MFWLKRLQQYTNSDKINTVYVEHLKKLNPVACAHLCLAFTWPTKKIRSVAFAKNFIV